jgi:hypothetical protein
MIISGVVLFFAAIAAALLWKRREIANMQSLIGGARVAPGCVIAEAIFVLLLAAAAIWLHQLGWLG